MEINLAKIAGQESKTSSINVLDSVFDVKFNPAVVHQVATSYLTNARAGTKAQKSRSEVRGGGAKPWRQKGTGRARAGTIRSPLWKGGGVTFAAKPKNYQVKINKKMYRQAMRSIFSELIRLGNLIVVESLVVNSKKTKAIATLLKEANLLKSTFIVVSEINEDLYLAARNLPGVLVGNVIEVNPISLMNFEKVLITLDALKRIEEMLK